MDWSRFLYAGLIAVVAVGTGVTARAQNEEVSPACTLRNDLYTCDKAKFEQVLAHATTAAVETAPTDAVALNASKKLIASTGKSLVDRGEHPDLTFLLVPTDQSGVQYTTNRAALATLRVYAADPRKAGRGVLVWVENFSGEPDTPWAMVVNRLASQFKAEFVPKR